jgi:hypothetical protein
MYLTYNIIQDSKGKGCWCCLHCIHWRLKSDAIGRGYIKEYTLLHFKLTTDKLTKTKYFRVSGYPIGVPVMALLSKEQASTRAAIQLAARR